MMNRIFKWRAGWILAAILAMGLGGCGRPKAAPPVQIAVEGEAAPIINRDANGDPLSVVVRIYHLKDKAEFSRLTFDLATSGRPDEELLGPDLLGRTEVVAVPGTLSRRTLDLAPGTNYLGIVACFRKPDPDYWRCLVSREQLVQARRGGKAWPGRKLPLLSFKVQDCLLLLAAGKPEPIPGLPERPNPNPRPTPLRKAP